MKKLLFLFSFLSLHFMGVAQKEIDLFALEADNITVENDLLVFQDDEQLVKVVQSLVSMASNPDFVKKTNEELGEETERANHYAVYTKFLQRYPSFRSAVVKVSLIEIKMIEMVQMIHFLMTLVLQLC